MTEKRFTYLDASKNHYIGSFFCNGVPLTNKKVVDLLNENEVLKKQIRNTIEMLKMEKETAISKNERIRLDFAISVLKELEE